MIMIIIIMIIITTIMIHSFSAPSSNNISFVASLDVAGSPGEDQRAGGPEKELQGKYWWAGDPPHQGL